MVRDNDTEPFSFGSRRPRGGGGGGGGRGGVGVGGGGGRGGVGGGGGAGAGAVQGALHQLALRLEGWTPPDPVCVDRVGVFFRNITHTVTASFLPQISILLKHYIELTLAWKFIRVLIRDYILLHQE